MPKRHRGTKDWHRGYTYRRKGKVVRVKGHYQHASGFGERY